MPSYLSKQQRQVLLELRRREDEGLGPQSAADFDGFGIQSEFSNKTYPLTEGAAAAVFRRLARRQVPMVERVGTRPVRWRLTADGLEALR